MVSASVPQLRHAQVLRLVAAMMVLFGHVQHEVVELKLDPNGAFQIFEPLPWKAGVDLFFVMSGFLMVFISWNRFGEPGYPAEFLKRRLIRIVPTYWLFTSLMLLSTSLFTSRVKHNTIDPLHVLASYLFLPWPRPAGGLLPVLGLGWTLNYEMLFYGAFALALLLPRRMGLAALALAFVATVAAHPWIPGGWGAVWYWSSPLILEFLFGVGLALLYQRGVRLPLFAAVALVAVGFALLVAVKAWDFLATPWRVIWGGVPALFIGAGFMLTPESPRPSRLLGTLAYGGGVSYALYLSHPFVINLSALIWQKVVRGHPWLFISIAMTAALLGAGLVYEWIEKPVLAALHRRFPSRVAPSALEKKS
jgi:peptidoglycan/LPS O-acetylase OafA/YrhL